MNDKLKKEQELEEIIQNHLITLFDVAGWSSEMRVLKVKQLLSLIQREREELLGEIELEKKKIIPYLESGETDIGTTLEMGLRDGYNSAVEDLEKIKSNLLKK